LVLGHAADHGLTDAYRAHLAEHPEELAAVKAQRPAGPLAVTIRTGGRRWSYPRRYDFIFVPQGVEVERVTHHCA